tara:strand:+ start:226 stop:483 length:258 start_codon:yes stop_codon:yes gene_type:complete
MENKYTEWPSIQRLKKADGTIAYIWDNKLHNWDGPALIPEGNEKKAEYYIYGIKYSKEEHKERIRQKTGLPWYKKPAPKGMTHRN